MSFLSFFDFSPILIKKLHEFIVEADVTVEEWRKLVDFALQIARADWLFLVAACALLVEAGQVTTDQRDEMVSRFVLPALVRQLSIRPSPACRSWFQMSWA